MTTTARFGAVPFGYMAAILVVAALVQALAAAGAFMLWFTFSRV